MNNELAELYGAMVGDGCLSHYYSNYDRKNKICCMITGHIHDEPYHRNILQPILLKNFGIKGYIWIRKKRNATLFSTSNKNVFNFFKNLNFPIGVKGEKLRIPKVILSKNKLSLACIRGIFDTDGTIYFRRKNEPVIEISSGDKRYLIEIKKCLNYLGFHANLGHNKVVIYQKKEIERFFEVIKPANTKHLNKYKKYLKSCAGGPVVKISAFHI